MKSQLLRSLLTSRVSSKLIHNFAQVLVDLIPTKGHSKSLIPFISLLVSSSQISSVVIYVAMIYLFRLRPVLHACTGLASTWHRLALSAMIIAEKFVCDVPMKNKYWQIHARVFSLEQVNLMERQLLSLLDYRLEINVDELYNLVIGNINPVLYYPKVDYEFGIPNVINPSINSLWGGQLPPTYIPMKQDTLSKNYNHEEGDYALVGLNTYT